jgi:hypothetical protein
MKLRFLFSSLLFSSLLFSSLLFCCSWAQTNPNTCISVGEISDLTIDNAPGIPDPDDYPNPDDYPSELYLSYKVTLGWLPTILSNVQDS